MKSGGVGGGMFALVAFGCLSAGPALADPRGFWLDKDGDSVRIHACGRAICGTIASLKSRRDPATGRPWADKHNADPGKRSRPLMGVRVLIAMQPNGPGKWSGRLYNIDDGKTYSGNLIERGPATVRVEGCSLGICGGENLSRMPSATNFSEKRERRSGQRLARP